jgi:hypothetical protein
MSFFDSSSRFLQPMRYDSLVTSHQSALKSESAVYEETKKKFFSQPCLVEMQLSWFGLHNEIPLAAVDWYEEEAAKGNIPYGIRICCNYTVAKTVGDQGEMLVPVFLQIRSSQKEVSPGKTVLETKTTLDFQENGNDYKLVAYRDAATLYRGSEAVERWARYRDFMQSNATAVWICEMSYRVQRRKIGPGMFAVSGTPFYTQVSGILSECIRGMDKENEGSYRLLVRQITRAISSVYRHKNAGKAYPALVLLSAASTKLAEVARSGKSFDPKDASELLLNLVRVLKESDPADSHVRELPNLS